MARDYQSKVNDDGGADSITETKFGAGEFDSIAQELANSVIKSGQTPAIQDGTSEIFTQIATAMFINGFSAQTFQDSGAADAYIVTPKTGVAGLVAPLSYAAMDGAIISFIPNFVNTGASTINFGQTAGTLLGNKAIITLAGGALAGGLLDATQYHEFMYSVSLNSWVFIGKKRAAEPVAGFFDAYAKWSDTVASGTDGGGFTAAAWRKRDINTEDSDTAAIGAIAGNVLTLDAGTYICSASCPGHSVGCHTARLQNTTAGTTLLTGTTANTTTTYTAEATLTRSFINGLFTVAAGQALELQHYCSDTRATDGFGRANGIATTSEVYSTIELWRVA